MSLQPLSDFVTTLTTRQAFPIRPGTEAQQTPRDDTPRPSHPRDAAFLARLEAAAIKRLTESGCGVSALARAVALSERQLQRRMKRLLGIAPRIYLRELRLQTAAALLSAGQAPTEVAFEAGYSSQSHLGARFKARFGVTPGVWYRQASNVGDLKKRRAPGRVSWCVLPAARTST